MVPPVWFVGIGAQKAGTTWLSHNLRQHPGVWDLPVKAFRFFNEPGPPLVIRALQPGIDNARWRRLIAMQLPHALLSPSRWRDAGWLLRFSLWPRTPQGYRALMTPPPGKIGGEVTPAYARLEADAVARVHQTVPEARIIYLLRHPVHRMWSQAAMHWRKQGVTDLRTVSTAALLAYCSEAAPVRNSDYLQTLSIWERFFRRDQIHVDFLERIADEPAAVLSDVYGFIGAEGEAPSPSAPRNVGRPPSIPDDIGRVLGRRYLDACRLYHQRFNNQYTAAWVDDCERLAAS